MRVLKPMLPQAPDQVIAPVAELNALVAVQAEHGATGEVAIGSLRSASLHHQGLQENSARGGAATRAERVVERVSGNYDTDRYHKTLTVTGYRSGRMHHESWIEAPQVPFLDVELLVPDHGASESGRRFFVTAQVDRIGHVGD
jgi:hypothetical protein